MGMISETLTLVALGQMPGPGAVRANTRAIRRAAKAPRPQLAQPLGAGPLLLDPARGLLALFGAGPGRGGRG